MNKGILYFSAPWCGPCKALSPQMEEIAKSGIPVKKINIDYDAEFPAKYSVKSILTVILCDLNGTEIKRHVGAFDGITAIKNWYNG